MSLSKTQTFTDLLGDAIIDIIGWWQSGLIYLKSQQKLQIHTICMVTL